MDDKKKKQICLVWKARRKKVHEQCWGPAHKDLLSKCSGTEVLHLTAWKHRYGFFILLLLVESQARTLEGHGDGWSKYQNTLRAEAIFSSMVSHYHLETIKKLP